MLIQPEFITIDPAHLESLRLEFPDVPFKQPVDDILVAAPGVFFSGGNMHHFVENAVRDNTYLFDVIRSDVALYERVRAQWADGEYREYEDAYGVCDNPYQVLEMYKGCLNAPRHLFYIELVPQYRAHQPAKDGWRWAKHGKYIGTQNRMADYLVDEPSIEQVFSFTIHSVTAGVGSAITAETALALLTPSIWES